MASDRTETPRSPSAWDRFWYGEASLLRLAGFRLVILGAALYAVFQFRRSVTQGTQEGMEFVQRQWRPIYVFDLLGIPPLSPDFAQFVFLALLVALAFAIAGLFTRWACAVVAGLAFLWMGTAYSFGQPHHDCVVLMFALLALPLGPAGARLSVDAWLRARRGAPLPDTAPSAALPWRVTQVTTALGYFFAGATKLSVSGLGWANGYTLQGIMLEFHGPWTPVFIASVPLLGVVSLLTLAFQAGFPLVLVVPRLAWFFVPASIAFHTITWKTMETGPFITLWMANVAAFVPWERVPGWLRRRLTVGPPVIRLLVGLVLLVLLLGFFRVYLRLVPAWALALFLPALFLLGRGASSGNEPPPARKEGTAT